MTASYEVILTVSVTRVRNASTFHGVRSLGIIPNDTSIVPGLPSSAVTNFYHLGEDNDQVTIHLLFLCTGRLSA